MRKQFESDHNTEEETSESEWSFKAKDDSETEAETQEADASSKAKKAAESARSNILISMLRFEILSSIALIVK